MVGWVSPRLGVRFEVEGGELRLYQPDGERFGTYVEVVAQWERERERAERERERAERLSAQLRALGVGPEGEEVER